MKTLKDKYKGSYYLTRIKEENLKKRRELIKITYFTYLFFFLTGWLYGIYAVSHTIKESFLITLVMIFICIFIVRISDDYTGRYR